MPERCAGHQDEQILRGLADPGGVEANAQGLLAVECEEARSTNTWHFLLAPFDGGGAAELVHTLGRFAKSACSAFLQRPNYDIALDMPIRYSPALRPLQHGEPCAVPSEIAPIAHCSFDGQGDLVDEMFGQCPDRGALPQAVQVEQGMEA